MDFDKSAMTDVTKLRSLHNQPLIGIGAAVAHRPLPHHRAHGSVHGGSKRLHSHISNSEGRPQLRKYAFESATLRASE